MHPADGFHHLRQPEGIHHLALGFFDGLHRGHQRVILHPRAQQERDALCVLTFRNHPLTHLRPLDAPRLITGLPHKLRLLQHWGVGQVLTLPFDGKRASQSAPDFLQEIHAALPGLSTLAAGPNFRFGHARGGSAELLASWCTGLGIDLVVPEPVREGDAWISSSRLRALIQEGNLDETHHLLGRTLSYFGTVVPGRRLGHTLGFPTANLATEDACLPPAGVYQGRALLDNGAAYPCAVNIGRAPTVSGGGETRIEAHLLDFSGDLYGAPLEVELLKALRSELTFDGLDDLRRAIARDVERVAALSAAGR